MPHDHSEEPSVSPETPSRKRRTRRRFALWLAVLAAGGVGVTFGLGVFTFHYAEGGSYFSNNPSSCVNCHVMQPQLDAWAKGSHHAVATCNDCHAPHDSTFDKLFVKGVNGFRHSLAFTTGDFEEPIRITGFNRAVTEAACRHCHNDFTASIDSVTASHHGDDKVSCIRCHSDVGHW